MQDVFNIDLPWTYIFVYGGEGGGITGNSGREICKERHIFLE